MNTLRTEYIDKIITALYQKQILDDTNLLNQVHEELQELSIYDETLKSILSIISEITSEVYHKGFSDAVNFIKEINTNDIVTEPASRTANIK